MGKSAAAKSQQLQTEAANRFNNLSDSLNAEAAPARKQVADAYSNIIKGGPAAYTTISPAVDFTKQQFQNARQTLNEGVAPGGARDRGYKQLAGTEATTISGLFRDKISEALSKLGELANFNTGASIQSTGGTSNAATALGQLAAARGQAVAAGVGGVSGAFGTYFGLKG